VQFSGLARHRRYVHIDGPATHDTRPLDHSVQRGSIYITAVGDPWKGLARDPNLVMKFAAFF
jgi:hypothetical protein